MAIDLRSLFDELRVPWKDRGANTSRGNVNICCPFCRDDTGYHMGISEEKDGAYYCFRRPQHAGAHLPIVLTKLGCDRATAVKLVNKHLHKSAGPRAPAAPPKPVAQQLAAWERMIPAIESDRCLDYLYERGFDDPEAVAERYDLRWTGRGKFAGRLLLPIKEGASVVAWTGRALRKDMEPKYLTEKSGREGLVYQPRPHRRLLIVVEGPLDALKLAVAGERTNTSAVALTGKQLSAARLTHLLMDSEEVEEGALALDADTALWEASRMLAELRGAFRLKPFRRAKLPEGYKDPGEMSLSSARQWIQELARASAAAL